MTASIGAASGSAPWTTEAIIAAADTAMYVAKGRGRNRVESTFEPEASSAVRRPCLSDVVVKDT